MWILSVCMFVMFGFLYGAFRMDTREKPPKRIEFVYYNGDKEVEVEDEEDDYPNFDRSNFKFN